MPKAKEAHKIVESLSAMSQKKHYLRAPIVEAIIDIQINEIPKIGLKAFEEAEVYFKSEYPKKETRISGRAEISFGDEQSIKTQKKTDGYFYRSPDNLNVLQFRLNGFTFSRLSPYDKWENFCEEAKRFWGIYRNAIPSIEVNRLAVRYINRLELPSDLSNMADYVKTYPEISSDMPHALSNYFMQLEIPLDDIEAILTLNQGMLKSTDPGWIPVLLDIDIYRVADFGSDEKTIWEFIDKLRVKKNEIFEACITDKLRELIQ